MKIWRSKAIALALSVAATLAMAQQPAEAEMQLHIAAQPLGDALNDLARQTGLQVALFADASTAVVTAKLNGVYTPSAALDKLLAGTGLHYEYINANTIAVRSRKESAADELKKNYWRRRG